MKYIYPDLEWYSSISEEKGLSPRCPYANVHRCPRYYSSLYLLGKIGITTKMDTVKISELDEYWSKTDLLPVVGENDPGVFSSNNQRHNFTNFCPEITFDVFGLFASSLFKYTDEIDRDYMHSKLVIEAEEKDWRWDYSSVKEMHFINCPVYSQILTCPDEKISNSINDEKDVLSVNNITENRRFLVGTILLPIILALIGVLNWANFSTAYDDYQCQLDGVKIEINYRGDQSNLVNIIDEKLKSCGATIIGTYKKNYTINPNLRWYWKEDSNQASYLIDKINSIITVSGYKKIRIEKNESLESQKGHDKKEFHIYL